MTALARGEVDRYLAEPDPRQPIVLLYGPDAGLVAERAGAIAARVTAGSTDPFALLRLDGDSLAGDPARLSIEANTVGLFGDRRAIRIRAGSKNILPAVEPLLSEPPRDSWIVIEAGDLKKNAPLRAACEKAASAAVVACYLDDPETVRRRVESALREAGQSIEPEALELLLSLLGGDRLATRGEIDKLIDYGGAGARLAVADVEAAVGDASITTVGEAVDGAFSGDPRAMLTALSRLSAAGERPDGALIAGLVHGWTLAQGLAQVAAGAPPRAVAQRAVSFFRRQPLFERQLKLWRREELTAILRLLGETILQARLQPAMAESLLERTFLRIALSARSAGAKRE